MILSQCRRLIESAMSPFPDYATTRVHVFQSIPTLFFRPARDQLSNCIPILATVRLYCLPQLAVFLFCPCIRTTIRPVDVGIQGIMPSPPILLF
jgi:hypothetical protein